VSRIAMAELEVALQFLDARGPRSLRSIEGWCDARDALARDILFFSRGLTQSCLATIAEGEASTGNQAGRAEVESAIVAAIVTALQVGVDVERRRRDAQELPL
jgi:hypothetical protein